MTNRARSRSIPRSRPALVRRRTTSFGYVVFAGGARRPAVCKGTPRPVAKRRTARRRRCADPCCPRLRARRHLVQTLGAAALTYARRRLLEVRGVGVVDAESRLCSVSRLCARSCRDERFRVHMHDHRSLPPSCVRTQPSSSVGVSKTGCPASVVGRVGSPRRRRSVLGRPSCAAPRVALSQRLPPRPANVRCR
jgi:hypothetical protein